MLGTHEADEVTQDIFVRTWQKLGQFRGESAFSTWLHRLAVNVVIERRRSFAIQRERMSDDPAALESLTVAPARADLTVDFEHAIEQLPPGAREIFVLHDVEGYKHREIAVMLDIATGTSKRQLHRARMLMRQASGWNDDARGMDGPAVGLSRRRAAGRTSARAVEAHLASAPPCTAVLNDLKRVVARAQAAATRALRRPTCGPASPNALTRAAHAGGVGCGVRQRHAPSSGRARAPHLVHAAPARGGERC